MPDNLDVKTFIEVKKLSKYFDQFLANDSISMNIKKGEIHALLGENGAGKSTLVKCLYGVIKPTTGKILINNNDVIINNPREARSFGIGMVFQHFSLFPALTVSENISLKFLIASGSPPVKVILEFSGRSLISLIQSSDFRAPFSLVRY